MKNSTSIRIENDGKITFFPLVIQPAREGKIFLGSKVTSSFVIVDNKWKKLKNLQGEVSVSKISHEIGTSIDEVKIFLLLIAPHKLIKAIDGDVLFEVTDSKFYSRKLVRIFDNKLVLFLHLILAAYAISLPITNHNLIPTYSDFFWSPYLSFTFLSYFLFTIFIIAEHEFVHFVIAAGYGVKGRFSLSNRLNFLVVESKFPNMYSISRKRRIAVFLSGTLTDLATTGVLYFLLIQSNSLLIKQFILLEWVAILWQFLFYMKTDFYFVIKELVGIENLYTYAKERFFGLLKLKWKTLPLTRDENLIVNLYMILFLVGSVLGLWRYLTFHLPVTLNLVFESFGEVIGGMKAGNFIWVLDGGVVLVIQGLVALMFGFIIVRKVVK
jgi:hypothetical protein